MKKNYLSFKAIHRLKNTSIWSKLVFIFEQNRMKLDQSNGGNHISLFVRTTHTSDTEPV